MRFNDELRLTQGLNWPLWIVPSQAKICTAWEMGVLNLQSQVTPARSSSRSSWEEMRVESFSCEIHYKQPCKGLMPLCSAYQNVG